MPTAAYLRVSPSDPEQESIENQRKLIRAYLTQRGLDVPREYWYEDDQVFSTTPLRDRPQGAWLMRDAQQRRFDTVVVSRVDRLARDPRLTLNDAYDLKQCGVSVLSVREGAFETPAEELMLTILAGFAGYERASIIERTGAGMHRVACEGTWMGGVPRYGYRVEGRKRDARLVLQHDPIPGVGMSEVQVVRWVYQHCAYERGSCENAAKHLNRLRVAPRGGGIWYASTIYRMLTSSTYYGADRWKGIERACPPIIERETWEAAQRQLALNRRMSRRKAKTEYLLGGILKCGLCGSGYVGRSVDQKKQYRYYVCLRRGLIYPPRDETVRCPGPNVPAQKIDDAVWAWLVGWAKNPGSVFQEWEESQREQPDLTRQLEAEMDSLRRELASSEDQKDLILGLYRTRCIDQAKLEQQFSDIDAQAEGLVERIELLDQRLRGVRYTEQQRQMAVSLLEEFHRRIEEGLSFQDKRYWALQLVESAVVEAEHVRVLCGFKKLLDVPVLELHAAHPLQLYRQYALERK